MKKYVVCIATLIMFGLGIFIGVFIIDDNDRIIDEESNNNLIDESNEKIDNTVNEAIILGQQLQTTVGRFYIEKDGTVYYEPFNEIKLYMNQFYSKDIINTSKLGKEDTYTLSSHKNIDGSELKIVGYKLNLANIRSAYDVYFGNGEERRTIMLLDKDGSVNLIDFKYDGRKILVNLEKVNEYKDIVSVVVTGRGAYVNLIDKNGNQYAYGYSD